MLCHCCGGLTLAGCQVPTKPLYHSPPQQDGAEKIRWKKLVGQDTGSLRKQNQKPCMEATENKRFALHFPSVDEVQPLPSKQCFRTRSGCSGRQMS